MYVEVSLSAPACLVSFLKPTPLLAVGRSTLKILLLVALTATQFQSGSHTPFFHRHTAAVLLRSWITFLTPGSCTWITLLMPGSCTWVTHLTLGFGITHLDTFLTAGSNHSHISPGQWRQVDSSWRKPQPSGCSRGTFI